MAGTKVDDEDQLDGPSILLPTVRPQVFEAGACAENHQRMKERQDEL